MLCKFKTENIFILLGNLDSSMSEKYFSHGRCVWLVQQAGPQGMTYTLDTVPRARDTFRAPPKCFHFHFFKNQKKSICTLLLLTLHKQTARYFSSKDGFIQNQQRIAVQGLQPWRATCKFPQSKRRKVLL